MSKIYCIHNIHFTRRRQKSLKILLASNTVSTAALQTFDNTKSKCSFQFNQESWLFNLKLNFRRKKVIAFLIFKKWADTMTVPRSASPPRTRIRLRKGQEGTGIKTGRSQRKEERGPLAPALMRTRGPDLGSGERKRRSTSPSQNTRNPKR